MKLEEIPPGFCYDRDTKKKGRAAGQARSKKECFIMLFAIFATALILAEMYFTRDTAYYALPDEPAYDYR